ncbi:peptidoglycan editing factor PgeF [Deinococcus arenicola]|uniref:Purine nucleoside phosphorylase n=1 Tax=Deinococcus arenicola TaxID=2994950 RepID=A0ABU4DMI6_9DEIO|nr:peptidoglycan editing factor PgeF [Deinococcus sp. ZS9-10]MDV6373100.1 peptidoglycan editing factor PgeF [Deinococcus sp. ZS9-10]
MTGDTSQLMLLTAPHLRTPHAFSMRGGGVSVGAYQGLNLDDREDDAQAVAENRRRLAAALDFDPAGFARLDQIHGVGVVTVTGPGVWTGDALTTATPGVLLAIGTADCYPLLFEDAQAGVVGAAHAGWKGTLGHIAEKTVEAMCELGARPERIRAAVGPGICGERYGVGVEVAAKFTEAGLGQFVLTGNGQPHLDLAGANRAVLLEAGLSEENIWLSGRCSTEADFYSYRRDAGKTGRMWAVIGFKTVDLKNGGLKNGGLKNGGEA